MSCIFAVCVDDLSEKSFREIYQRMPKDRQTRTDGHKHHIDKMRSVAAFHALETGLMQYENMDYTSRTIKISYGESGKPYLPDFSEIDFSISHSGKYAICAVGRDGDIGADILHIRKTDMRVAKRFFAPSEIVQLEQTDDEAERDRLFAQIWTRKESYVKFTGEGLKVDLSDFAMDPLTKRLIMHDRIFPVQFWEIEEPEGYIITVCCNIEQAETWEYKKIDPNHD